MEKRHFLWVTIILMNILESILPSRPMALCVRRRLDEELRDLLAEEGEVGALVMTTALSSCVAPRDSTSNYTTMPASCGRASSKENSRILSQSLREKLQDARRRINERPAMSKGKDNLDSPEKSRHRAVLPPKELNEKIEERKPQGYQRRKATEAFVN